MHDRSPAARTGRGPHSSLKSDLPNGRVMPGYVSRAFLGLRDDKDPSEVVRERAQ